MHYRWGQTAAKNRKVATLNSAHEVKKTRQFWKWLVGTRAGQFAEVFLNVLKLAERNYIKEQGPT